MHVSPMLEEELSLLQCAIVPPQVTSFDATQQLFTTAYRDYQLSVTIPPDYPNHTEEIPLQLSPEDGLINGKCRSAINDALPGEYVLLDICQAFRSSVDRQLQALDKADAPSPVSFFSVTSALRKLLASNVQASGEDEPLKGTFFDFAKSPVFSPADSAGDMHSLERCMHSVSFESTKSRTGAPQTKKASKSRLNKNTSGPLNAAVKIKNIKPMASGYPSLENLSFITPTRGTSDPLPKTFSVLTWNILCELFDEENKKESTKRFPLLVRELEKCAADIIALQEVTPEMWQKLIDETSLNASYFVTKLPSDVALGQIILTKHEIVKCEVLRLSVQKHAIIVTLSTSTGRALRVVNIQLVSDYAKNAACRRMSELANIGKAIDDTVDTILLGDFNFGDEDEEEKNVPWGSFIDAWHILRGSEPGITFDFARNGLAKISSGPTESSRRLDKMKIKGLLVPSDIHITGKSKTTDGLYASSHYAVKAVLMQEKSFLPFEPGVRLDMQTAVVILPPEGTWSAIDALRDGFDPRHPRWMPHIPLLHPFIHINEAQLPLVVNALQCIAKRFPPFRIRLQDFTSVTRKDVASIYLNAEPVRPFEGSIRRLHSMLITAYSMCCAPHFAKVAIGECRAEDAASLCAEMESCWSPSIFDVTHIHVISRPTQADAMVVRSSIQLGFFNSTTQDSAQLAARREVPSSARTEPTDPPAMTLEPNPALRLHPKPYFPSDAFEQWLLEKNVVEFAGRRTTHFSQKGAMYHIPEKEIDALLAVWKGVIETKEDFFIEEKLSERFRLYVDVDFKLSTRGNLAIEGTKLLEIILTHAMCFFDGCDPTVCVTASHSRVFDKSNPDVQSKSGYRVYFQQIWVDAETYGRFLESLAVLCGTLMDPPAQCASNMTWRSIVNTYAAHYDRCRLLGSAKKRKGFGRRYSLHDYFTIKRLPMNTFKDSVELANLYAVQPRLDLRKAAAVSMEKALFSTLTSSWGSSHVSKASLDNNRLRDATYYTADRVCDEYAQAVNAKKHPKN